MWFGAVFADCAVFLGPKGLFLASLRWQELCSVSFENMKIANVPPRNHLHRTIPRGCVGLARVLTHHIHGGACT